MTAPSLPAASPPRRSARVTTAELLERLESTRTTPGWKVLHTFATKNSAFPRATRLRAVAPPGFEIATNGAELIAQYVGGEDTDG